MTPTDRMFEQMGDALQVLAGARSAPYTPVEHRRAEPSAVEDENTRREAAETRLRSVYAAMACGVIVQDVAGVPTFANAAAMQLFGSIIGIPSDEIPLSESMSPSVLEGFLWHSATVRVLDEAGNELAEDEMPSKVALRTGAAQRNLTVGVQASEGPIRWLLTDTVPVLTGTGLASEVILSFVEITERQRAEVERERLVAELAAERTQLRAVLDQMPAAVLVTDPGTGKVLLSNAQVEQIWRSPFPMTSGQAQDAGCQIFHADGTPYEPGEWPLPRVLSTGEPVADEELKLVLSDGTRSWIRANAAPVRQADGQVVAAVATFFDIQRAGAAGTGTAPLQSGSGAVRLRRLPRSAGAAAHGEPVHAAAGTALSG
ncbi:MAG: PAS domain-containing protein [Dehalococcoidia bacterium]